MDLSQTLEQKEKQKQELGYEKFKEYINQKITESIDSGVSLVKINLDLDTIFIEHEHNCSITQDTIDYLIGYYQSQGLTVEHIKTKGYHNQYGGHKGENTLKIHLH